MPESFYKDFGLGNDTFERTLSSKIVPSLGLVYLKRERETYVNPSSFFKRTFLTRSMLVVLRNVAEILSGKSPNSLIPLDGLLRGGKTHTMLTVFHAVNSPSALSFVMLENESLREELEDVRRLFLSVKKRERVKIVVMDGSVPETMPSPTNTGVLKAEGFTIKTPWGYLAYQLGKYPEFREYDEKLILPPVDKLVELFLGNNLLILIDEIDDYINKFKNSGDEIMKKYVIQVILFLEFFAKAIEFTQGSNIAALISSSPNVDIF